MGMYVIYDELAKESAPIFLARTDELALRQFQASLPQIPEAISRDMRLYRVGFFDSHSMLITGAQPVIVDASSLLEKE